jgi:hypothetical protein
MRSKLVWALVALNVLLAATLAARWMKPQTAMAAQAGGAARPGDYIMVPAEVVGGSSTLIFVVDTSNNQLSGMAFDQNQLVALPPIDLTRVFDARAVGAGVGAGRPGARE